MQSILRWIRLAPVVALIFGVFTLPVRAAGVGRIDITYGTMKEGEPYSTAGLTAVGSNGVVMTGYKFYCGANQTTITREQNYISVSFNCTQALDRVDIYVNGTYCDFHDCKGGQPAVGGHTIKTEDGKGSRYFPATIQLHHRVYSDGVYDEELFKDIVYSYYDGEPALPVTAPECPVTREGYIFSGWKQESKEETYMYSLPYIVSGWRRYGIEYTAVWRKPLTITGETTIKKSTLPDRSHEFTVTGVASLDEFKGIAIDNKNATSDQYVNRLLYDKYQWVSDGTTKLYIYGDAFKNLSAGTHTLTVYYKTELGTIDKVTHTFTVINDLAQGGSEDNVPGWKKDSRGWWFLRADGSYPKNAWEKIGGKWYHFDTNGYMQTGWVKAGGKWYYMNASGAMQTGWVKAGGKWYYMNASGAMQTGWIKTGGKWYYLNGSGAMLADTTRTIGGKRYSFRKNGVCINP